MAHNFLWCVSDVPLVCLLQIQGSIRPHAIIILPNSAGTEVLVCYEDEGVYIDTYGRITKDTVLQWGEMPASVGTSSLNTRQDDLHISELPSLITNKSQGIYSPTPLPGRGVGLAGA